MSLWVELGTIPNNPDSISSLLKKMMPVFIEFDKDFIKSKGVVMWKVWTKIKYDEVEFIRLMQKNPKLLMLGNYRFIGYWDDRIHCWEVEDVDHVGDDVIWLPYQTPILYHHFDDYDYSLEKYLYIEEPTSSFKPTIELYIRGWRDGATVKFCALGLGQKREKYIRMAKKLFDSVDDAGN